MSLFGHPPLLAKSHEIDFFSRIQQSFWNLSIKKWSDTTSPLLYYMFHTMKFIALLVVLSTEIVAKISHKKLGLPDPLPLFRSKSNFLVAFLRGGVKN